jgi:hypothetical protein
MTVQILPVRRPLWPIRELRLFVLLYLGLLVASCADRRQGVESASAHGSAISGPRFTDITRAAGITYQWSIPDKRPLNLLQTIGNGCALFDYDGDGNLDILLVGSKLALYRGDGHGHFADVSRQSGVADLSGRFLGCAAGDYDNDGRPDLYISGYRTGALLHNERGARFRDVTRESGIAPQPWGTSCAFADIDGDGRLDLYIGNYVKFGPDTVPQMCKRNGIPTSCGPIAYQAERGALYRNLGGGQFRNDTSAMGADCVSGKALGVAFAPSGQHAPLLAIANDEVPGDLLRLDGARFVNDGPRSGTGFSDAGNAHGGMGIDWGDYDNDGRLDLAVATFEDEVKPVFHNESNGYFEDRSQSLGVAVTALPYVAFGIKWFDFDNNGWLDLCVTNGHISDNVAEFDQAHTYRQPTLLFHNVQGTRFEEIGRAVGPDFARPIVGRGLAVGDIDNDGRQDMLIVDSEGAPILLHNETPQAGHWLLVKLVGTKCNRDGYGAIVTAAVNGHTLTRHCHSDGSYLSASDPRVHFGMGPATSADLTVRWPDGTAESFPTVQADRQITLREGSGHPLMR